MKKLDDFKKIYFNIIPDIWEVCSRYKNQDFTKENEDNICKAMVNDFQSVKDKYSNDGKAGKLVNAIVVAILEFVF